MSIAESPIQTVKRFSRTWNTLNQKQLKSEFESISSETNRKPDTYYFEVKGEKLFDPNTGKPVENFVGGNEERKVFLDLQTWASSNNEGLGIWISPKIEGVYPCGKVIISKIAYDLDRNKYLLNTAILVDTNDNFINPEYKRGVIYHADDIEDNVQKILRFISRKSEKEIILDTSSVTQKSAEYFVGLMTHGAPIDRVINEMFSTGFVGQNSISCPNLSQSFGYSKFFETKKWSYHIGDCVNPGCNRTNVEVGPCNICKVCENKL